MEQKINSIVTYVFSIYLFCNIMCEYVYSVLHCIVFRVNLYLLLDFIAFMNSLLVHNQCILLLLLLLPAHLRSIPLPFFFFRRFLFSNSIYDYTSTSIHLTNCLYLIKLISFYCIHTVNNLLYYNVNINIVSAHFILSSSSFRFNTFVAQQKFMNEKQKS